MWSQQFNDPHSRSAVLRVYCDIALKLILVIHGSFLHGKVNLYISLLVSSGYLVILENVKEFGNFFERSVGHLPIFHPISSKIVNSFFPSKMLNFVIFHPFPSKTILDRKMVELELDNVD